MLTLRGAYGIVGLGRAFRVMDRNRDGGLSIAEFSQAVRDFKIQLTQDDTSFIFNQFDTNKDGRLDYNEFLRCVRGEMNAFRRGLAEQAFQVLDKNGNGVVEIADVAQTYSAKKNPAVIEGRKTEEQVLSEFLETFEIHHNLLNNEQANNEVTLAEFIEYYNNVSASIDDDKYFEVMMDGSWNLSGHANPYMRVDKGWFEQVGPNTTLSTVYQYKNTDPYATSGPRVETTMRTGLESHDNPWSTTETYYVHESPRKSMSNPKHLQPARTHQQVTGSQSNRIDTNRTQQLIHDDFIQCKPLPREVPPSAPKLDATLVALRTRAKASLFSQGLAAPLELLR